MDKNSSPSTDSLYSFAWLDLRDKPVTAAGDFASVGPGWDGDLPPGVRRVAPAPTPWVLVLGRTAVNGVADLPAARGLQQQYRLTPLSLWGVTGAVVPDRRDVYAPAPASDPLGPWKTLKAMLVENPPPSSDWIRCGSGTGQVSGSRLHPPRRWFRTDDRVGLLACPACHRGGRLGDRVVGSLRERQRPRRRPLQRSGAYVG